MRLVEEDARFRAAVERSIAAAERGEFVDHKEVWSNIERLCSPDANPVDGSRC